jgi:hypothetical protein
MFRTSVQALQLGTCLLRFCFVSAKNIRIQPEFNAFRADATLIALDDLIADAGSTIIDAAQKQSWKSEILRSAFLVEPLLKEDFLAALNGNQKVLWFRGTVAVEGKFQNAEDVAQIHFEATRKIHSALGSFPFVEIVEGGEQWQ